MHLHNKSDTRLFSGLRLPGLVSLGMVLLACAAVNAQPAKRGGSPWSTTKQEAHRLVAMTQPGYYKTLLVPDWRVNQANRTTAATAVAKLCSHARKQAVAPTLEFRGERVDEGQVLLRWNVSEVADNEGFGVERSLNPGDDFEPVVFVHSRGSSAQAVPYQTIDPNTQADFTYYRLKRVDATGAYIYSPTIAVKGERAPLAVKAFPNPSPLPNVRFEMAGLPATAALSVSVYDGQGRLLYQNAQSVLDGNRRFGLPASLGLQPGKYYLKVITQAQQVSTTFIIQP